MAKAPPQSKSRSGAQGRSSSDGEEFLNILKYHLERGKGCDCKEFYRKISVSEDFVGNGTEPTLT